MSRADTNVNLINFECVPIVVISRKNHARLGLVGPPELEGTVEVHSGGVPGVHALRPIRWHDAGVEVLQLFVPRLLQVLPVARDDREERCVLRVRSSHSVHGEQPDSARTFAAGVIHTHICISAGTSNPTVSEGTGCVLPPARGFVEVYRVAYGHLFLEMRLEEDSSKRLVDT